MCVCIFVFVYIVFINFEGKFGKIWPGLNTTVEITPQKKFKKRFKDGYLLKPHMSEVSAAKPTKRSSPTSILERETKTEEKMPAWKKAFLKGEKMYGQELSSRGWSGKTWRGREFRAPETVTGGVHYFLLYFYFALILQ